MANFLTESDAQRIADAVRNVESRTEAELVPVVALQSDDYRYIPVLAVLFLAMVFPSIFWVFGVPWPLPGPLDPYSGQLILATIGIALVQWTPLRHKLVPRYIKRRRAARMAREQFVEQSVHLAPKHCGVLLFVSAAEHYVEILADQGLADRVDNAEWQKAVDDFTGLVRQGKVAEGFEAAIGDIGEILSRVAPVSETKDRNALPDRLVVIG